MEQLNKIIQDLFEDGKTIPFSAVPFKPEVRKLCEQNMCGYYGKSWTCPPAIEPLEELMVRLSKFNHAVIVKKVYQLEDSFDWDGMKNGIKDFQSRIMKLKTKIMKACPDLHFMVLGAGACSLCETCTYEQQLPCRHPDNAIFSVEAFGIDVMEMMRENGLNYNNGKNTVTYVGTVFLVHPYAA